MPLIANIQHPYYVGRKPTTSTAVSAKKTSLIWQVKQAKSSSKVYVEPMRFSSRSKISFHNNPFLSLPLPKYAIQAIIDSVTTKSKLTLCHLSVCDDGVCEWIMDLMILSIAHWYPASWHRKSTSRKGPLACPIKLDLPSTIGSWLAHYASPYSAVINWLNLIVMRSWWHLFYRYWFSRFINA